MSWGDNYYDLKDREPLDVEGKPAGEVMDLNHYNSVYSTDKNVSPFWYYIKRAKDSGLAGANGKGAVVFENGGNLAVLANSHDYKYRKYYDMMYSFLRYRQGVTVQSLGEPTISIIPAKDSVLIRYTTNSPTNMRLVYGTAASGKFNRELNDSFFTGTRTITLRGLAPGTKYNCKVSGDDFGDKQILNKQVSFTTLK
jgi:hypothetical protein